MGNTVSPFDNIGKLPAIDRSASNNANIWEKVQKIKQLISTRTYGADILKYISGTLALVYQGILEDIDTKRKSCLYFL